VVTVATLQTNDMFCDHTGIFSVVQSRKTQEDNQL